MLIRVGQTVANCDTLEFQVHISGVELKVVGYSGHIVTGIGLASDVEVTTFVLGVLHKEPAKHCSHIFSNLIFGSSVVNATLGEARTNGLVNVKQV